MVDKISNSGLSGLLDRIKDNQAAVAEKSAEDKKEDKAVELSGRLGAGEGEIRDVDQADALARSLGKSSSQALGALGSLDESLVADLLKED